MSRHLDHKQEALLESLLAGSLPHNIRWNDVVELIGKLGTVEPHGGVEFAFVVGSQRAFFKRPSTQSLDSGEIARIRKFLREAGQGATEGTKVKPIRMAVVIDHHLARVYEDLDASRAESEVGVTPHDPHGFHRHLIHRKEAHYQGERVPEEHSFYEDIAQDLVPAQEIVLIGHSIGTSSALDFLAEFLKKHHSTIYQRVVATEVADLSALSEPEIDVMARKYI